MRRPISLVRTDSSPAAETPRASAAAAASKGASLAIAQDLRFGLQAIMGSADAGAKEGLEGGDEVEVEKEEGEKGQCRYRQYRYYLRYLVW